MKIPQCPHTKQNCYIDIFRGYSIDPNIHCDTCPDYKRNYDIILKETIKHAEKNPNSNIHLIRNDVKKYGGKYVSFSVNDYGLLIGATSTVEDYYWLFLNKDRKLQFSSCVGMFEVLDNTPANMSVVEYLRHHNPKDLYNIIKDQVKNLNHDVLITPIYLWEGKPFIDYEQKSRNKNSRSKGRSNI